MSAANPAESRSSRASASTSPARDPNSTYTVERATPASRATSSTLSAPTGPRSRLARAASRIRPRVASADSARRLWRYRRLSMLTPVYFIGQTVRHRTHCTTKSREEPPAMTAPSPTTSTTSATSSSSAPARPASSRPSSWPATASARSSSSAIRRPRSSRGRPACRPARWRSSGRTASRTRSAAAAGGSSRARRRVARLDDRSPVESPLGFPDEAASQAVSPTMAAVSPAGPPRAAPRRAPSVARGRGPLLDRARVVRPGRRWRDRGPRRSRERRPHDGAVRLRRRRGRASQHGPRAGGHPDGRPRRPRALPQPALPGRPRRGPR